VVEAQIITIGHEILRGEIINTNAAHIARELRKRGIHVSLILTLPDNRDIATEQLKRCMLEKGIIIITGGLGGTADDVTRTIVSGMLRRALVVDVRAEKHLREWYSSKGRSFEKSDRLQAAYPAGGMLLSNEVGLAYGFYVQDGDRHIFSLPGVPAEMKGMFHKGVMNLMDNIGLIGKERGYAILNFIDISEYTLDRIVQGIVKDHVGVEYGTRASNGLIRVRIESKMEDLEECLSEIEKKVPDNFVCRGEVGLEEVVGSMLGKQNCTLSVAESCTGGLLSKTITDIPGSSRYFLGGVVAYSNDIKSGILGVQADTLVKFGAVSENTAKEMAVGVLERFSSHIALSVTGIAGPGGETSDKPVGTVYICLADRAGLIDVQRNQYMGDRDTVRKRSVNKALSMAFLYLRDQKG
jgi:nicotinamide-nucleotide amidase